MTYAPADLRNMDILMSPAVFHRRAARSAMPSSPQTLAFHRNQRSVSFFSLWPERSGERWRSADLLSRMRAGVTLAGIVAIEKRIFRGKGTRYRGLHRSV